MVEVEELDIAAPRARRKRLEWLLTVLIRPGKAMREIAAEERGVWHLPLILLTVLTLAFVLVAGPLRQEAARNAQVEPPESFQYMTPEQQEQWMQAQASASGPMQTYLFPAVGALMGLWGSWFVLSGILHLVLTMLGSRSNSTAAFNLAGWASLPFVIRLIVQIVAMLTMHRLIASPGLSGFIAADSEGALAFARVVLSLVDIYLLWQIILLWIGAASTGLRSVKAFSGVLISSLLVLLIAAAPGFIIGLMSGFGVNQPIYFMF